MGALSIWHILILAAVALVLFGGRGKVSDLMGDFGKGINSFKKGLGEPDKEDPRVINSEARTDTTTNTDKDHKTTVSAVGGAMFDLFSWSHIVILLIVALVVVGPKDLPRLMHMAGKWAGKARAMANEFKTSFDEMARQSELEELRKEIDALRNQAVSDISAEINDRSAIDSAVAMPSVRSGEFRSAAQRRTVAMSRRTPRRGEFEITEPSRLTVAEIEPPA